MKQQTQLNVFFNKTVLPFAIVMFFSTNSVSVNAANPKDDMDLKFSKSFKAVKFSRSMKVRGFQLSKGVYFGHAKVGGEYGIGFLVDRKSYFWGLNNRGFSISRRF